MKTEKEAMGNGIKMLEAIGMLDDSLLDLGANRSRTIRKRLAAAVAVVLCLTASVPVFAKKIPAVYRTLDRLAPELADSIIPNELIDEEEGIRMQVEAAKVEGNEASLVVSFSDAPGFHRISGAVDLFDSYNLRSFDTDLSVGGCSFLEYNEEEQKSYFRINVLGDGVYSKDKIEFTVNTLLTNVQKWEQEIPLSGIGEASATKKVEIFGAGGIDNGAAYNGLYDGKSAEVIVCSDKKDIKKDELSITGVAYQDGILRVQSCRGDVTSADRHLQLELEIRGKVYEKSMGVCWGEQIHGEPLTFDEAWFAISPDELKESRLVGIYHIADTPVYGNWKVITRLE